MIYLSIKLYMPISMSHYLFPSNQKPKKVISQSPVIRQFTQKKQLNMIYIFFML